MKSAIKTAKVSSFLTKCPVLLKSAIKTAKVCSLSDNSFSAIKTANGWQFVSHLRNLSIFLLKSATLLTDPLKMLKSAIKTAKVWQFVYVATKLPRKKRFRNSRSGTVSEMVKVARGGGIPRKYTVSCDTIHNAKDEKFILG